MVLLVVFESRLLWTDDASSGRLTSSARPQPPHAQGLSILRSLRQVATTFVKISAEMADPEKAGGLFEAYAVKLHSDPGYTALLARIEGGDRAAANELQQRVADEAWGGCE